jgi:hypothetical protein
MLRPDIQEIVKNCKFNDRYELSQRLINLWYPNHWVYWIDGQQDYLHITHKFRSKPGQYNHILIAQTEEDWFYKYQLKGLRSQIQNDPAWTKRSVLLTNSAKDMAISRRYIRTIHKPGLLDLISYLPYTTQNPKIDLEYHCAFMYSSPRKERDEIADIVSSSLQYSAYRYEGVEKTQMYLPKSMYYGLPPDCPWIDIESDLDYMSKTAFNIVLETLNQKSAKTVSRFGPTLSEKTFKNMHLMRPALVFGGHNTRQYLRRLGFDTWDWFIDWSFDSEKNNDKAFQMYKTELHRLLNTPIEELQKLITDNKKSLLHNRRHIFKLINNYLD